MLRRPRLDSAVARNLENPLTFEIPSEKERKSLKPGDFAKIIVIPRAKGTPTGERIWVKVIKVLSGGRYLGAFANRPIFFSADMEDEVIFKPDHIADTGIETEENNMN